MSAAHGGYGSEKVPLGGGAAVFERLVRSRAFSKHSLDLLAPGPQATEHGTYHRILPTDRAPSALSMMEYAGFSRDFGAATTQAVLELKPDVLICHDISEGPDVRALAEAGIPVVTIFHVDVVDIFNRLYLGGVASAESLAALYRKTRRFPWPEVLKLVFAKQQDVMSYGALSVVPSSGSQQLVERAYPSSPSPVLTIGWGVPECPYGAAEIARRAADLRTEHGIAENHRILLTLSRLSPEKAQHRLLEAILWAEHNQRMPDDMTVVIAGAPAFMEGPRHYKRLQTLARRLKTRVIFPGHVGGLDKAAWYSTADIFVVNSLHESYGLTTLEAMQQGCPVVAVRSFGTADTVTEEVGRLVIPGPDLPLRLWGTLELYLKPEGTERLRKLSENARRKAERETFEKAAETLERAVIECSPPLSTMCK